MFSTSTFLFEIIIYYYNINLIVEMLHLMFVYKKQKISINIIKDDYINSSITYDIITIILKILSEEII